MLSAELGELVIVVSVEGSRLGVLVGEVTGVVTGATTVEDVVDFDVVSELIVGGVESVIA